LPHSGGGNKAKSQQKRHKRKSNLPAQTSAARSFKFTQSRRKSRRRNASAKFVKFRKIDEKFIKAFYRFNLRDLAASRRQIRARAAKRRAAKYATDSTSPG